MLENDGQQLGWEYKAIHEIHFDPEFVAQFSRELLIEKRFIPVFKDVSVVCFALDNPFNPYIDHLTASYSQTLKIILVTSGAFDTFLGIHNSEKAISTDYLHSLFYQAIEKNASDIHIQKYQNYSMIILRVSGELETIDKCDGEQEFKLFRLLKVHSNMDIAKSRLPQDGQISISYNQETYDIRVSSLPTVYGEDFVCRIFKPHSDDLSFDSIGMSAQVRDLSLSGLKNKSGLILVNGPTGSGKTTTLYTFLSYLKEIKKIIITIEDPVEYVLPGIRQSQVNLSIGYDFSMGLKSCLRQDPDILMIGEIRERSAAKACIDAAYTGHLVLSSLHTSDVKSTLLRLASFDLDPFMVIHSLRAVVSQKLVAGTQGRVLLNEFLLIKNPIFNRENPFDFEMMTQANAYYSFEQDLEVKKGQGLISADYEL